MPPLSRGLGRGPLKAETGVRIPSEVLHAESMDSAFFSVLPRHHLFYPPRQSLATTLSMPDRDLQPTGLQVAGLPSADPSIRLKCKFTGERFFPDFLHCLLDFPARMHIIGAVRRCLQEILHDIGIYGQEGTTMMWILLAALVGVVTLSVKEQLDRERDAACLHQLARENIL